MNPGERICLIKNKHLSLQGISESVGLSVLMVWKHTVYFCLSMSCSIILSNDLQLSPPALGWDVFTSLKTCSPRKDIKCNSVNLRRGLVPKCKNLSFFFF